MVYVLATYNYGTTSQNLLTSKSRIAPKNVSVPRLELVAAHTLAKLVNHVNQTFVRPSTETYVVRQHDNPLLACQQRNLVHGT